MLDLLYKIYNFSSNLPYGLKILKVDSILRNSAQYLANYWMYIYPNKNKSMYKIDNNQPLINGRRIIVSMTSFPARIEKVWMVVESLLHQRQKMHKIILWLSKEQFSSIESLPDKLTAQIERGLEIRFVDGDYRSHKKYLYAFKEYPKDYVVLVDDDIIYPSDFISGLLTNMELGNRVNCSYGCMIRYDSKGNLLPYNSWEGIIHENTSNRCFFFGSGGGTIFIPSVLHPDICNIEDAFMLCPTADDVWLNAMCRISGLKCCKVRGGLIFPVKIKNDQTLFEVNGGLSQNDIQINRTIDYCIKKYNINPFGNV